MAVFMACMVSIVTRHVLDTVNTTRHAIRGLDSVMQAVMLDGKVLFVKMVMQKIIIADLRLYASVFYFYTLLHIA